MSGISINNADEKYFLIKGYFEGLLGTSQQQTFDNLNATNPQFQKDVETYKTSSLIVDTLGDQHLLEDLDLSEPSKESVDQLKKFLGK